LNDTRYERWIRESNKVYYLLLYKKQKISDSDDNEARDADYNRETDATLDSSCVNVESTSNLDGAVRADCALSDDLQLHSLDDDDDAHSESSFDAGEDDDCEPSEHECQRPRIWSAAQCSDQDTLFMCCKGWKKTWNSTEDYI